MTASISIIGILETIYKKFVLIRLQKFRVNDSYEETSNIRKTKKKIKRLYYHIANIRKDYLHKTTHELISKCPKRVVMETLCVQDLMKNKHLAKYIQEQCFYEFKRQMKYKCEWNGIEFVEVERYYPSSKTCSCCGAIKKDLKLFHIKQYVSCQALAFFQAISATISSTAPCGENWIYLHAHGCKLTAFKGQGKRGGRNTVFPHCHAHSITGKGMGKKDGKKPPTSPDGVIQERVFYQSLQSKVLSHV